MLLTVLLTGCKQLTTKFKLTYQEYNPEYFLAVIETTEQDNRSIIHYYNNELILVNTQILPYGTMGNLYYTPVIYNNVVYTIPQGLGNKKDAGIVLGMKLETGELEEYKIDQLAMNSLAVNNQFIYTSNTLNGISSISQYEISNGTVKQIDIEDVYISKLYVNAQILYAFGQTKGDNGKLITYLYTLDQSLTILDKKDISDHGSGQYKTTLIGNELYFTSSTDSDDNPSNKLSCMSLEGEITDIILNEQGPLEIIPYQDKILISHCNLAQARGNKLTILDMKNNTQQIIEFEHDLLQMQVKDNNLYVMDQDHLYIYIIEKDYFTLERQVKIKTTEGEDEYYYISGFFIK
ncbi:MAG: hypothetical protein K0R21_1203 [Anaerocolumna sp.]|jgi:hypothetical protein|nr:hypothetical protein [Anaerocolumna sp.]